MTQPAVAHQRRFCRSRGVPTTTPNATWSAKLSTRASLLTAHSTASELCCASRELVG